MRTRRIKRRGTFVAWPLVCSRRARASIAREQVERYEMTRIQSALETGEIGASILAYPIGAGLSALVR
jgi:hypothetical protein